MTTNAINLASEPFRPMRRMIVGAGAAATLLTALLVVLIALAVSQKGQAAQTRERIAKLEKQLQTLSGEQAVLTAQLRKPENAEVLDRSLFLNSIIYAKAISWTRLFDDLEKVVPYNVQVIYVRPQVNGRNEISLDMVVGSQAAEPMIQMLKRMERSPDFGATRINTRMPPSQSDPLLRYRISVDYKQKL